MKKFFQILYSVLKGILIVVLSIIALLVGIYVIIRFKDSVIDRPKEAILVVSAIEGECNSKQVYQVDSVILGGWRLKEKTINLANQKDTLLAIDGKKKYLVKGEFTFYEQSTEFYCRDTYEFIDKEFTIFK